MINDLILNNLDLPSDCLEDENMLPSGLGNVPVGGRPDKSAQDERGPGKLSAGNPAVRCGEGGRGQKPKAV